MDTIPHAELLRSVARRIADGYMLHLIKMWLTVPVEEREEGGRRRLHGGKSQKRGTPQGGVISPLLANVYMNRFLKHWRQQGMGEQYRARIVNYADDFVILSRGHASEARDWARATLERIGLTLNEQKTVIRDARTETFDFLGYTFGLRYWRLAELLLLRDTGRRVWGAQRACAAASSALSAAAASPDAGTRDSELAQGNHLRQTGYPLAEPFTTCEPVVKSVGKPDAGDPHVRFDERGWETGDCQ